MIPIVATLIKYQYMKAGAHRPDRFVLSVRDRIYIASISVHQQETTIEEETLSHHGTLLAKAYPILASIPYKEHKLLRPVLETLLEPEELWVEVPQRQRLVLPTAHGYIRVEPDGRRTPMRCRVFVAGKRVYNHIAADGIMMPDDDPSHPLPNPTSAVLSAAEPTPSPRRARVRHRASPLLSSI